MKNTNITDERILLQRRKIQSIAYSGIVYVLLGSIIVQQFFLRAPFSQYAVEFFVLIGCGIFQAIANYSKGIDIWNPDGQKKSRMLFDAITSGVLSLALFVFLTGEHDARTCIIFFIAIVTTLFVMRVMMATFTRIKQNAIDRECGCDDDAEDNI